MMEEILDGLLIMNSLCKKKGQGHAIHISDFICETIGRLQLNKEQKLFEIGNKISHKAQITMNPEKNNDG
jgi:hypothetical protein